MINNSLLGINPNSLHWLREMHTIRRQQEESNLQNQASVAAAASQAQIESQDLRDKMQPLEVNLQRQ